VWVDAGDVNLEIPVPRPRNSSAARGRAERKRWGEKSDNRTDGRKSTGRRSERHILSSLRRSRDGKGERGRESIDRAGTEKKAKVGGEVFLNYNP